MLADMLGQSATWMSIRHRVSSIHVQSCLLPEIFPMPSLSNPSLHGLHCPLSVLNFVDASHLQFAILLPQTMLDQGRWTISILTLELDTS